MEKPGGQDGAELSILGQIAIPVRDVERATSFYRDTLGVPFLFDVPGQMAFFDCGGVRLMVAGPEGGSAPESSNGTVLYFRVDDIEAVHQRLEGRGVEFLRPPHQIARMQDHDLWMAFFADGEGSTLALMSEVLR